MREHFNLYYLFLEDKSKNPMPEGKRIMVRKKIQKIIKKHKTILNQYPP